MSDTEKQNDLITVCKELLKTNKNIILNGAPGTGKTYLAKQIAAKMIGKEYKGESTDNDPIFKEHVRLVQFHPSYDYTDFVEGLRPISADGQIGFKLRDGAFKKFCKSAWDKTFKNLIKDLFESGMTIESSIYNDPYTFNVVGFDEANNITINNEEETQKYIVGTSILEKAFKSSEIINDAWFTTKLGEEKPFFTDQNNALISKYYYVLYRVILSVEYTYVFIIDEINRGEISKIFGELFFSIDPGYRGTKGRVDTQYQNLITDNDCFKDGFYVPENVYIIGTMNDIDRSVESMDFAFRRRFAFKEVQASDTQYMLSELGQDVKIVEDVKKRMTNLNKAIEKAGFTSAYHVGASYFLKLKESGYDVGKLWDYHLKGLLKEYLRGREDAEKILNDWKHAYGLKNGK